MKENSHASESRRFDRNRTASKLSSGMIKYDSKRRISKANSATTTNKSSVNLANNSANDLFSYKKISRCYDHMIRILIILISKSEDIESDKSTNLKDAQTRSD